MIAIFTFALAMAAQQAGQQTAAPQDVSEQLACAPLSLPAAPAASIRVIGGYQHGRLMFSGGEPLVINAGAAQGIRAGQQYFVRRYVHDRFSGSYTGFTPHSVHTTGWVTIGEVKENIAVATVSHACDGIIAGDYLEPFVSPVAPPASATTVSAADFDHPARIVMADERRQMGYPGLVMFVDRGSDDGVRPGQAVTIYRGAGNGGGPAVTVGSATVLTVSPQTSLVRIETSRDAIFIGDLAAIHRITQ